MNPTIDCVSERYANALPGSHTMIDKDVDYTQWRCHMHL